MYVLLMSNHSTAAAQSLAARAAKRPADAKLIQHTEAQTTAVLLAGHAGLTLKDDLAAEERLVLATIADVLTARYDLDDTLGVLFDDETNDGLNYHELLLIALAADGLEL